MECTSYICLSSNRHRCIKKLDKVSFNESIISNRPIFTIKFIIAFLDCLVWFAQHYWSYEYSQEFHFPKYRSEQIFQDLFASFCNSSQGIH